MSSRAPAVPQFDDESQIIARLQSLTGNRGDTTQVLQKSVDMLQTLGQQLDALIEDNRRMMQEQAKLQEQHYKLAAQMQTAQGTRSGHRR
ncbi:hypothetical protein CONPUDRAFT_83746 [Coniophora puteana RWD-64-598 SS2]|uniref:Uncharacterized protein n=1 Tax=Coniophora puteana (strain RWD-64-598) TaxID=741705 RepID=A0A5M3MGT1_CONPW|nr:uncharacterized protein CONPUDRAFT_83746 [Coniophora puteana RWD-64-598 SS2]EIW78267.1 hypothetical protein CONPUDRAFT_83746 [Coniophora puteana RWD-64-598 SS2]